MAKLPRISVLEQLLKHALLAATHSKVLKQLKKKLKLKQRFKAMMNKQINKTIRICYLAHAKGSQQVHKVVVDSIDVTV